MSLKPVERGTRIFAGRGAGRHVEPADHRHGGSLGDVPPSRSDT